MVGVNVSTNRYATSNIIVAPTIAEGAMFTSIGSALTYAVANSLTDIFIKPGTYTENFTLPAGINLIAYNTDGMVPTVTIVGKITMTAAGTSTISGIRLQTNSDFFLVVSGTLASQITLQNCYLNCTNNTGISYTSSSASSGVNILRSQANINTTGIALFSSSGAGNFGINWSGVANTGGSTTNSTHSDGTLGINWSLIEHSITTSGTSTIFLYNSIIAGVNNNTALTIGGSGANSTISSYLNGGTASALSLSTTLIASNLQISSSNANAISGTGTITYSSINFSNSSSTIQGTITQTNRTMQAGTINANTAITTPSLTINSGTAITTYVEGTFSPTVQTSNANMTGISYTTQVGKYVKMGNFVTVNVNITFSNTGAGTGLLVVDNLPYTVQNTSSYVPIGTLYTANITFPGGTAYGSSYGQANATQARFIFTASGGAATILTTTTFTNAQLNFTLTYRAA